MLLHVKLLPMDECQEEWLERHRSNPLQYSPNSYDRWTPRAMSEVCYWMYVLYFMHICSIEEIKTLYSLIAFEWLTSHGCIHLTLSWNNNCWTAPSNVTKEKISQHRQGALKVMYAMFFSWNGLVYDHPMPIFLLTCRIRWGQLFVINNQNYWNMVPFSPGQCSNSLPLWCAQFGAVLGLGGVGTSSLLSRSRTMWLLVVYTCETVMFRENDLNQKTVSTLLSLPLYVVWARMNAELELITVLFKLLHIYTL